MIGDVQFSAFLSDHDLQDIISQFHFSDSDLDLLTALYHEVSGLLEPRFFYDILSGSSVDKFASVNLDDYAVAILSLGSSIDDLISRYMTQDELLEAYMLDCIGLKLLSTAYKSLISAVENSSGLYVSSLEFLGDNYDLSLLPEILSHLDISSNFVTISATQMLTPLKSVALILPLADEKPSASDYSACDICSNCNNQSCLIRKRHNTSSFNPHTYGFERIFGLSNR